MCPAGQILKSASTLQQLAWHIQGRRMIRRLTTPSSKDVTEVEYATDWYSESPRCRQRLRSVIATKWKPTYPNV
jgi:hypothetical protein